MSEIMISTLGMKLLIKPLILRQKQDSKLPQEQEKWIFDAFNINNQLKKKIKISKSLKKISFSRIFLLMHCHY